MVDPNKAARGAGATFKKGGTGVKNRAVKAGKYAVGMYTGTAPIVQRLEKKADEKPRHKRRSESERVVDEKAA